MARLALGVPALLIHGGGLVVVSMEKKIADI